jgi:hypothetical protein
MPGEIAHDLTHDLERALPETVGQFDIPLTPVGVERGWAALEQSPAASEVSLGSQEAKIGRAARFYRHPHRALGCYDLVEPPGLVAGEPLFFNSDYLAEPVAGVHHVIADFEQHGLLLTLSCDRDRH